MLEAGRKTQMSLRIHVDGDRATLCQRQCRRQIQTGRGLSYATFLIEYGDDRHVDTSPHKWGRVLKPSISDANTMIAHRVVTPVCAVCGFDRPFGLNLLRRLVFTASQETSPSQNVVTRP